ncbi:MAG: DEAD/DEAH box helicase family protein [Chloroflexota bacterium]
MPASQPTATAPGADLATRLAAATCVHRFRHYQELALAAFERARATGDRHIYLTMPPGSGKTLLGLEIGRRMARPMVALAPTTAIRGQWVAQWSGSFAPRVADATTDGHRVAELGAGVGLMALTYQSMVVLHPTDEASAADAAERARRRLVTRGGDPDALVGLLHPNGRALLDRLAALGPITLILDECHHLLRLWGHVLEAVVGRIHPDSLVLGLTATPPTDLGAREAALHRALFGGAADFEVVTPAVVKDGFLAPYQELALLVPPLDGELRFMAQEQERFELLRGEVLDADFASVPFASWFARRFLERRSAEGATASWWELERADPALARAALRLRWSRDEPPPHGARFREQHRVPPETADWVALIEAWVMEVLAPSTETLDSIALERDPAWRCPRSAFGLPGMASRPWPRSPTGCCARRVPSHRRWCGSWRPRRRSWGTGSGRWCCATSARASIPVHGPGRARAGGRGVRCSIGRRSSIPHSGAVADPGHGSHRGVHPTHRHGARRRRGRRPGRGPDAGGLRRSRPPGSAMGIPGAGRSRSTWMRLAGRRRSGCRW